MNSHKENVKHSSGAHQENVTKPHRTQHVNVTYLTEHYKQHRGHVFIEIELAEISNPI
jgi:hypothetical protein